MSGKEGRKEDWYSRERGGGERRRVPLVSKQRAPDLLPNAWVVKETSHIQRPGGSPRGLWGSPGVSGDLGGKCGTFPQLK